MVVLAVCVDLAKSTEFLTFPQQEFGTFRRNWTQLEAHFYSIHQSVSCCFYGS